MGKVNNAKEQQENKRKKVQNGQWWSINNKKVSGHIGEICDIKKDGTIEAVVITHSKYTHGIKNINLKENPNPDDNSQAYVLKKKQSGNIKHLGKKHDEMKVKNPVDKSIIRHIKKRK